MNGLVLRVEDWALPDERDSDFFSNLPGSDLNMIVHEAI